jgi:hypothetical protein
LDPPLDQTDVCPIEATCQGELFLRYGSFPPDFPECLPKSLLRTRGRLYVPAAPLRQQANADMLAMIILRIIVRIFEASKISAGSTEEWQSYMPKSEFKVFAP